MSNDLTTLSALFINQVTTSALLLLPFTEYAIERLTYRVVTDLKEPIPPDPGMGKLVITTAGDARTPVEIRSCYGWGWNVRLEWK